MFDGMKLSNRLAAGFGILLLLLAAVAGTAGWQMRMLAANTEAFAGNIVPSLALQYQMTQSLGAFRRWELRHALADDIAEMDRIEAEMARERKSMIDAIARYEKDMLVDDEDRRGLDATRQTFNAYLAVWDGGERELSRLTATDPTAEKKLKAMLAANLQAFQNAQKALDAWWQYNEKLGDKTRLESESTYASAKLTMALLVAASFVLGIGAALLITRSVLAQIGGEPAEAKRIVGEIAQGNLAVSIALRAGDRDSLLAAMQGMKDRLAAIVSQVRASSDSIATGSSQIASGNADLSQRTEEQASNLQQTAASMEQLSGTVKTSAATAAQANQLASGASAAAAHGGEMVGHVVETMQEISAASKKIADIIGTIDGIAFQTNILALNAAVEAARAGEQGRGFAVVAGEVRTLAQRSAEAAKEIKTLIGASVDKVEAGARQVNDAGASMNEIVAQVQRVSQMIGELSNAATEQSSGIGQVNDAMTQLDQVTQQNAALVEQSAAAAESLRHQADRLAQAVGVFQLDAAQALGGAAPARAAKPAATSRPAATARKPETPAAATPAPARAAVSGADDWTTF